jgi:hypothetical protein
MFDLHTTFAADIPRGLAAGAHQGTSFVPETRAQQEIDGYAATLAADFESLSRFADTDDKRATLLTEFGRYRVGYKLRTIALLSAKARCVSTMIAGPSGFPVGRARKASDRADARSSELVEFRRRALAAIFRVLRPEAAPVMSGDDDAVKRLREKLDTVENEQERMKDANAAIRKRPGRSPARRRSDGVAGRAPMRLCPRAPRRWAKDVRRPRPLLVSGPPSARRRRVPAPRTRERRAHRP